MTRSEALRLIQLAVRQSMEIDPKATVFIDEEDVDYTSEGPIVVTAPAFGRCSLRKTGVHIWKGVTLGSTRTS
jgi:hypothetical protein